MYILFLLCLFERFVNMYLLSMFVNYHTCCALVLLFGTNCSHEYRNNCWMFAIRHVWYNAFVNLQCIIQCVTEIVKSLLVWPTVLFEATICVRMMHWSRYLYIGKNKKKVVGVVGLCLYCVCHLEWYFPFWNLFFFPTVKLHVLGIAPLFDLLICTTVDGIKDYKLYNKVWKDIWTYWDTCQYWWKRQLNTCKWLKHDKTTHVLTDLISSTTRGGIYIYYNAWMAWLISVFLSNKYFA